MATVDLATKLGSGLHPTVAGVKNNPHYAEKIVNIATVVTTKGSAMAAADVIEAIDIPANSVIVAAGVEVQTAVGGGGSAITIDVGVTGIDADAFVDGYDLFAGVAGDFAAQPAAYQPIVIGNTADTLDVLIATQTGTIATGIFRVWCIYHDVSDLRQPGIAALKS